jgi:hypothetical protein
MRWAALGSVATVAAALAAVCLGSGCSSVGYYAQSVGGHLDLLQRARPIDDWLADPATPTALKARLQVAQQARRFAVTDLALPDNASYTRHADLGRGAVVWNVVAAPPLSLTLKTWCYPVMGCVGYRGYFDQAQAEAEGAALRAQGLEVSVYGVPAYSTLGWTNWIGGDPLLNTLVGGSEAYTVRLIFHELAHQQLYVAGDTMFNESYATAVERLGLARWQATTGRSADDPAVAQRAPVSSLCVADFDGDGHDDLFLSQNLSTAHPFAERSDAGRGLWLRGDGRGGFVPEENSGVRVQGDGRGAAVCDYDADGRVDLAVGQNGAETTLWRNVSARPGLRVRLSGVGGNPTAVGARVRWKSASGFGPWREIHLGSGDGSCDDPVLVLGVGDQKVDAVEIRWPGGSSATVPVTAGQREVMASQPAR